MDVHDLIRKAKGELFRMVQTIGARAPLPGPGGVVRRQNDFSEAC